MALAVEDKSATLAWQHPSFDEEFEATARIVGIREFTSPSLEAVERRRSELWTIAFLVICVLAIGMLLLSVGGGAVGQVQRITHMPAFRIALLASTLGLAAYVLEKERNLRYLTRLLMDERILTAALSNRLKELATLCEVGKAVNSVLALEDVLDIILSSALELLEGKSGSIMLVDGDELEVLSEHGNEAARHARVRIGEGVSGQVAERREPLLISGRVGEARHVPVASAVCVPLINRGELLGVLNVNGRDDRPFTEYDLRALSLFADHAAISIANSRLYEAERSHVAELMELDRMKSDFVATVSHELRTPLTSILGCAKTLQRRELPEKVEREFVEMIERQGTRLLHLVEDIMQVQRTVSTDSVLCRPVDLGACLEEVVRMQDSAGRHVALYAPRGLIVLGEPDALQRVFTNLIDNAFSHGGGEVEVEAVASISDGDGQPVIEVAVLDRGPGIAAEDREAVFERFKRGSEAFSPGMGLGLYLVRSLVEGQGGRVWVTDRAGGGAAFRVALSAAPAVPGPGVGVRP